MAFNRKYDPAPAAPVGTAPGAPGTFMTPPASQPPSGAMPASAMSAAMVESVIGNDLEIEGDQITIRCKGSLTVNGNIQADLHSRRLQVGKEAVVSGAIAADTVEVFGRVQGAILGAKVILHNGADVEGDIMSTLLSVEEGANFDGRSRRVTDPAAIAPQLESTAKTGDKGAYAQPFAKHDARPAGTGAHASFN